MPNEIVFIHGMFMTPKSWENWTSFFSNHGYTCHAPAWPLHDAEPAELRAHVPSGTGDLVLSDVIAEMERAVLACATPPIVIGHSVGGLITQVLVNEGLASAGVCVSSVAPNAMLSLEWHFLKSTMPILNPIKGDEPQEMTPERFHETFANTLGEAESRQAYERYAVHESRNVLRTSLGSAGQVDLKKPHAPLFFVTGAADHIIPASLVKTNFEAYDTEAGIKEIQIFEGRGHFLCNEPGWQEIAEAVEGFLSRQFGVPSPHVDISQPAYIA